ncbi:putative F-box protein At1g47730 [Rutidosis leptorrhynchoides]|uniref:putative F-box protein At1g47730 n=1 Tax=Rutidosis leptorrhynchoides TaxID=125765 RepID=UPI003A98F3C8
MSEHIPFDIQIKIVKRLDVKSLIRFRSVSKVCKSLIDSPKFVSSYGIDHIQNHLLLVSYLKESTYNDIYMSFVDDDDDDDDDTFLVGQIIVPMLPREPVIHGIVGSSHGLFCLRCSYYTDGSTKDMYIIWNPSIRKMAAINDPTYIVVSNDDVYFGVCPVTRDPKLVRITNLDGLTWLVKIYTLSSASWRKICNNLPRGTVTLDPGSVVVTNRNVYWKATDSITDAKDGSFREVYMIVSFDLTSEEFNVIGIPTFIAHPEYEISKLRDSLVVYNIITPSNMLGYGVMGFTKSGTPIITMRDYDKQRDGLYVFKPDSERVTKIGMEEGGIMTSGESSERTQTDN